MTDKKPEPAPLAFTRDQVQTIRNLFLETLASRFPGRACEWTSPEIHQAIGEINSNIGLVDDLLQTFLPIPYGGKSSVIDDRTLLYATLKTILGV